MALYGTDIQRWTMVKALEKTNTKGSGLSAFCKKVPKYGKVKPLLERWQTCLITPAKWFVKVNQLGHWSSALYRASIHHDGQYSANINAAKCAEGNVLPNLRRIPTLWAHLSCTLSVWLLQVRVSLKITPRCLWIFTCGIGMPAIDTEGCGATPFNPLPQTIICSLFSALNSIPQISACSIVWAGPHWGYFSHLCSLLLNFFWKVLENMKKMTPLLCACAVMITLETQKCRKRAPRFVEFNLFTNRHRWKRFSPNERRRANLQNVASKFLIFAWGRQVSYDLSKFSDDFTSFFRFWKTITESVGNN